MVLVEVRRELAVESVAEHYQARDGANPKTETWRTWPRRMPSMSCAAVSASVWRTMTGSHRGYVLLPRAAARPAGRGRSHAGLHTGKRRGPSPGGGQPHDLSGPRQPEG